MCIQTDLAILNLTLFTPYALLKPHALYALLKPHTRLLSILIHNYCIYNNLTTHEYCYYDLIIKRGLTKSDATKLLNELTNKANSVKSI